jgi:hypothetical protein
LIRYRRYQTFSARVRATNEEGCRGTNLKEVVERSRVSLKKHLTPTKERAARKVTGIEREGLCMVESKDRWWVLKKNKNLMTLSNCK